MEPAFTERAASWTITGRRPVNEDAVLLAQLAPGLELVAVADGMGGALAGDVASNRALQVLHSAVASGDELLTAVRLANTAVFEEAASRPECQGMGTTLVAILRQDGHYTVANVGDSRAYRIDRLGIHQLTQDNSFVAEAVRSGQLSAEEAERSLWRNAVTRCVGTDRDLEVDCYGPYDPVDPHTLLLCTDGVYRALSPDALRLLVQRSPGPEAAVRAIADAAYEAGSDDNISVAVIGFGAATQSLRDARGPSPLIMPPPAPRRRRSHRRLPGGWTLARAAIILLVTILAVAYFLRN